MCADRAEKARRSARSIRIVGGKVEAASRESFTLAKRAAIRTAELRRLAEYRRTNGVPSDPIGWLTVALRTLAERNTKQGHQPTMTRREAAAVLTQIGCELPAMVADKVIAQVNAGLAAALKARSAAEFQAADMSPLMAGRLLELDRFDRDELKITTIEATDESRAARSARKKKEKAKRDAELKESKRRTAGVLPRAEYEAASLEKAKPWEAEGISRRTWYARRKRSSGCAPKSDCTSAALTLLREKPCAPDLCNVHAHPFASKQEGRAGGPEAPSADAWFASVRNAIAKNIARDPSIQRQAREIAELEILGHIRPPALKTQAYFGPSFRLAALFEWREA